LKIKLSTYSEPEDTLATFNNGNSHIIMDDNCYVVVNRAFALDKTELDYYSPTSWISQEAWQVLSGLGAIPMLLWCPDCGERHIDKGEFATKVHHTHACQTCGHVWRPAIVPTLGVQFLPGFKNDK
jgi:rubredoxin